MTDYARTPASPEVNVRKLVFNLHLYVGLTVGLVLVAAGLTGSVLVFRHDVDALLHPELLLVEPAGERAPLQEVVERVRAAYPEHPPVRVWMPRAPEEVYVLTLAGEEGRMVYVDPYRATLLGTRLPADHFVGWLFQVHTTLLAGETGHLVMGTSALLLLVLVLTGVVVWWPGMRRLADGFRMKWSASWKRVNWDLHRVGGIWSTALLTVTAVTGASLVFHDAFMAGLDRATASPPRPAPPVVVPVAGAPQLPLDSLVARAERALPGGTLTNLVLPAKPEAALVVRKRFDQELHPNGRNFIHVHPWSGEVLALENALTAPAGTRAYNVLYPLHIGRWGGWVSKVLYALLGLTPLLLFASGLLMWWNRTQVPKRRKRRSARAREAGGAERKKPVARPRAPAAPAVAARLRE